MGFAQVYTNTALHDWKQTNKQTNKQTTHKLNWQSERVAIS